MLINHISLKYMYKVDLALNNQQWTICHKTHPNQTKLVTPVFFPGLWGPFQVHYLQLVSPIPLSFTVFFSTLWQDLSICLSFLLIVHRNGKIDQTTIFFLVNQLSVYSSGRDYTIRLYLKIPVNFMRLILLGGI